MSPRKIIDYGHDVEGNEYRVKYDLITGKEIERKPTGRRIIWITSYGGTANFGIKAFKRLQGNRKKRDSYLIKTYKENSWNNARMKREIATTALKAVKDKKDE